MSKTNATLFALTLLIANLDVPTCFSQLPQVEAMAERKGSGPEQPSSPLSSQQMQPDSRAREVPAEKFRSAVAQELAGTKGKATARLKNPKAGDKGIKPSVTMVLQEQRLAANAHTQAIGIEKAQYGSGLQQPHGFLLRPQRLGPRTAVHRPI